MLARLLVLMVAIGGMVLFGVPAHAAVVDAQLDDSGQATAPAPSYYWTPWGSVQVANFLAVGYVPPRSESVAGVRFRINESGGGVYTCPTNVGISRYGGTSNPAMDYGEFLGTLRVVATTTPDASGNCDYVTRNVYGADAPVAFVPNFYYVFLIGTGNGEWNNLNWVSMSGKPRASADTQSLFGYRPVTDGRFVWGTTGLDAVYFKLFDTPPPPPNPCVSGGCVSNVLFLPGIEASRLYRPDYAGGTDRLWEPSSDADAADLSLSLTGTSVRSDVYTKDVVDEAYTTGPNIYKSFIEQMNGLKSAGTIADWRAVPYDWRLSFDEVLNGGREFPDGRIYYAGDLAATSSPYIIQELRRLAKTSKTGKVTIVAHSNGGLLAKALMGKLGAEATALVDKIVFVAVPQAGTPQAIGALLHGYDQGLPKDWFSVFLSLAAARLLATNMPSAYNLLPSADYFTHVDTSVITFDNSDFLAEFRARYGSQIHDGTQLEHFITDPWRLSAASMNNLQYPSVGNAVLMTRARTLHATLDAWTPPQGVSLYEIAGWGEDTLSAIRYREGKKASCSNLLDIRTCKIESVIAYDPVEVVEGDGTVLVPSALWMPASTGVQKYWVNLRKYDDIRYGNFERKHADILEVPELRTLIQSVITNSISTLPAFVFITTTQPILESSDNRGRLRFVLHSPLNLSATDDLGNTVSSTTSAIPGARWKRYGEVQVLSVPSGTPFTVKLDGYAAGSFTLDMQEVDGANAVIASSTLSAIPSTAHTKAVMEFASGTLQGASPLRLDYDGNGTIDFSLPPRLGEEVVFDVTPPEASITFDPVSRTLQVIGEDEASAVTVLTTATSSTITDKAGNTLEILFKKLKQEGGSLKFELLSLRYNGVAADKLSEVALHYEWSIDKAGNLQELEEKAVIGRQKIEGHYDAKKNVTKIGVKDRKDRDEKESKRTLPELVVVGLTTKNGKISISY